MSLLTCVPPQGGALQRSWRAKATTQQIGLLSAGEVPGAQRVHRASRNPQGEAAAGMHHLSGAVWSHILHVNFLVKPMLVSCNVQSD